MSHYGTVTGNYTSVLNSTIEFHSHFQPLQTLVTRVAENVEYIS